MSLKQVRNINLGLIIIKVSSKEVKVIIKLLLYNCIELKTNSEVQTFQPKIKYEFLNNPLLVGNNLVTLERKETTNIVGCFERGRKTQSLETTSGQQLKTFN